MVAVPAADVQYIKQAAAGTGLPYAVVAAQVNEESGFNLNATSPTGAEGPYQFEPGTYASYGTGSEYNWANETAAYIKYMNVLLKEEGGSVEKALAAYNAGPGNIGAGMGYADTILSAAGQGTSITDKGGSGSAATPTPATTTSIGGSIVNDIFSGILQATGVDSVVDLLERGALILFGVILLIIGLNKFISDKTSANPVQIFENNQKETHKQERESVEDAAKPEAPAELPSTTALTPIETAAEVAA
jgi:Transglycosylase SLT domain